MKRRVLRVLLRADWCKALYGCAAILVGLLAGQVVTHWIIALVF